MKHLSVYADKFFYAKYDILKGKIKFFRYYWLRYVLAVISVLAAVFIRWVLKFFIADDLPIYITFYPAIVIAALLGGLGPGLFATLLAAMVVDDWLIVPQSFLSFGNVTEMIGLILFVLVGVFISVLAGRYVYVQRNIEEEVDKAKNKLLKSEAQYYSLFQNSPLPVWEEDFSEVKKRLDGLKAAGFSDIEKYLKENLEVVSELVDCIKIKIANKSALSFFKAENNEEFINKFSKIFKKRTLELFRRQITDFYLGKKNFWCEGIIMTLAGESKYIEINITVLDGHEIDLDKIIVSAVDITDRKSTENSLKESQRKMIKAEEIAYLGNWEIDLATNNLSCSAQVYHIFGLPPDTIPTHELFLAAIHPADRATVQAVYSNSLAQGQDACEVEHRIIKKSTGEIRIVHEKCENIKDVSGKIIKSVGVVQDVTDDRRIEEELRRTRHYLESLLDNANAPIIVWNPELKITKFNHAFERLTGYQEDEVIGKDLSFLFPLSTKEESLVKINQTLSGEHWEIVEMPIQKKNGELRTVLWNSANIYGPKEVDIIATIAQGQDITKLKEVDKAKSEFISMASHQLRTPLSSISLSSELLLRGIAGKLEDDPRGYVEEIFISTQKMSEIINDLLNVSKIEMGVNEIRLQNFNVAKFADNLLSELNLQILKNGLILERVYAPEGLEVDFDKNILTAIVENLITNSIQYTPAGGKITITIKMSDKGPLIMVADNGCGISKVEQDKIFNKFFRAENAKKYDAGGSGLGLYIVKSLADKTGVKIWFESEVGKGTTFYVLLPKN